MMNFQCAKEELNPKGVKVQWLDRISNTECFNENKEPVAADVGGNIITDIATGNTTHTHTHNHIILEQSLMLFEQRPTKSDGNKIEIL